MSVFGTDEYRLKARWNVPQAKHEFILERKVKVTHKSWRPTLEWREQHVSTDKEWCKQTAAHFNLTLPTSEGLAW